MSVVGFDIGTLKCTIGVAKGGGIEIVLNEESDRFTSSCVAFGDRLRYIGSQAKQHMSTNPQNCVFDLKRMIGRPLSDSLVQHEKKLLGCELVSGPTGEVAAKVNYLNEPHEFTMTQLMAMLLVKLKTSTESGLNMKTMKDCVISVPCFFTDIERQCMLNASAIAGLNCLKLLNETTAVALCYGIFRTDFPAEVPPPTTPEAAPAPAPTSVSAPYVGKSKIVAFIDIGHAASQLCLVAFNAGKLRVLTSVYDSQLGGRDFDARLYNHFVAEFKTKYKVDVNSKRRAQLRLFVECERLKKLMSANSSNVQMNIDSLIEDRDVTSQMKRADFEGLCADLLDRIEQLVRSLLTQGGIQPSEVDDIEIVGGSTRMPAIRERIKIVFGREPSTTLNADEAVARGCAIQCAILSPNFRVREFAVNDCLQYPITIEWDKTMENEENVMNMFTKSDKLPASKMLTLNKSAPFTISARYTNPEEVPHPVKNLGSYIVRDVPANSTKVKVKVRVNKHGIFSVAEATAYEKVIEIVPVEQPAPVPAPADGTAPTTAESPKEPMEQGTAPPVPAPEPMNGTNGDAPKDAEMDNSNLDGVDAANATPAKDQPVQTTQKVKMHAHDLPMDLMNVPGLLTDTDLRNFIERENAIQSQNKMEKDRVDSKNAVEEYVLNMNRDLSESLNPYASPTEAKALSELCETTNNWLYDEGEDQPRSVYTDRLSQLTKIGEPIRRRQFEHQHRPAAFDHMGRVLLHYRKIVDCYKTKDDKYAHLEQADMEKVEKSLAEKQAWFDEKQTKQMARKVFEDPIVFADQILKEAEFLEKFCNPIVTRPKPAPKPPTPPPVEKPAADEKLADEVNTNGTAKPGTTTAPGQDGMELD